MSLEALRSWRGYLFGLLLVGVLAGGAFLVIHWPRPEPIQIVQGHTAEPEPTLAPTEAMLLVHVVGAVQAPGVYALPAGSRTQDAVAAAGGLLADADAARINLADYCRDAQQIYVPHLGEQMQPPPTPVGGASGESAAPASAGGCVNVNTATAAELEALPGIGPAYAERIVAYREAHGPFSRPEGIMEVSGIGPSRYAQIRDLICTE